VTQRDPQSYEGALLSERQSMVLRAMISAYVGEGAPVGSGTLSHLLPVALSSASIRNTMAELTQLGLIDKPHASAGRVPTELGLRFFVDELMDARDLAPYEKRDLAGTLGEADGTALMRATSQVLSDRTRQLGFVLAPRLARVVFQRVNLIRLSSSRLLAVLVAEGGSLSQRVVEHDGSASQAELERMQALLNEHIAGRTLGQVRAWLVGEADRLRSQADRILRRALDVAVQALQPEPEAGDLVVASWLALLDQPEFHDLDRVRQLLAAVETQERLVEILDEMLSLGGVRVAFGDEVGEPSLRSCALVAAPYGDESRPVGVLGVIGPRRMDYARVVPLVDYLSRLVSGRIGP
jgi:heat-inducible transcriptional repressor